VKPSQPTVHPDISVNSIRLYSVIQAGCCGKDIIIGLKYWRQLVLADTAAAGAQRNKMPEHHARTLIAVGLLTCLTKPKPLLNFNSTAAANNTCEMSFMRFKLSMTSCWFSFTFSTSVALKSNLNEKYSACASIYSSACSVIWAAVLSNFCRICAWPPLSRCSMVWFSNASAFVK